MRADLRIIRSDQLLTGQQVLALRAAVGYAMANVDDVNEAFSHGDNIKVGGVVARSFTESEYETLLDLLNEVELQW